MARVLIRLIQEIAPDKWQQLDGIDKKFDELESKMGFPPKKRYRGLMGPDLNTLVVERVWESMAKAEEVMSMANSDPEYLTLSVQLIGVVLSQRFEAFLVI